MRNADFRVRVRGADETRYYRIQGDEALELRRMLDGGQLDRPPGTERIAEIIEQLIPERVIDAGAMDSTDVDYDMVSDEELRQYLSQRLGERKRLRENAASTPGEPPQTDVGGGPTVRH